MEPFDTRETPQRERTDLSAARLDRLRAAPVPVRTAPRPVIAWTLTAVLLAFALGLIANPWFERSVRSRLPGFAPTMTPTLADVGALETRIAALEARPAVRTAGPAAADPAAGERIARVEGALATLTTTGPAATARTDKLTADVAALSARVDAASAATATTLDSATASATRAQAMLIAGAVRRQLAAGMRLGPLEPALRRSFGARAAPQVEAVAALGATPVTAATLRTGLATLRAGVTGATAAAPGVGRGWWAGLRDSLAGVVVRPAGTATDPAARLDRADRALAAGDVAAASAEVAALPAVQRARTATWSAAAERYQAGWRAMAALETMLLDPLPLTSGPGGGTGVAR